VMCCVLKLNFSPELHFISYEARKTPILLICYAAICVATNTGIFKSL